MIPVSIVRHINPSVLSILRAVLSFFLPQNAMENDVRCAS